MNRIALAFARRYGHTPAWGFARRVVDRGERYLAGLSLYLYQHDGQRIAREVVREREKEEAGKQALAELDALIARLSAKDKVEAVPTLEDAERFREAGKALGRKVIEDLCLRASSGKVGRN